MQSTHYWHYAVVCLCTVVTKCVLQQKCLNKWIGSVPWGHGFTTFNAPTSTLSLQTSHQQNFTILLCFVDHFVYLVEKSFGCGKYCYRADDCCMTGYFWVTAVLLVCVYTDQYLFGLLVLQPTDCLERPLQRELSQFKKIISRKKTHTVSEVARCDGFIMLMIISLFCHYACVSVSSIGTPTLSCSETKIIFPEISWLCLLRKLNFNNTCMDDMLYSACSQLVEHLALVIHNWSNYRQPVTWIHYQREFAHYELWKYTQSATTFYRSIRLMIFIIVLLAIFTCSHVRETRKIHCTVIIVNSVKYVLIEMRIFNWIP